MLMCSLIVPAVLWQRLLLTQQPPHDAVGARRQSSDTQTQQTLTDFERFFARFAPQITGYLCRMVNDEQAAFDLCQETFFRAWQHFADLRQGPAARAWLYRVATNLAAHHHRQRTTHKIVPLDDLLPGASDPGKRVVESMQVAQVLQTLTPKQRSALLLHEVQGLSCDEIGQILQISRDAVKMALFRAREQFRLHYLREEDA